MSAALVPGRIRLVAPLVNWFVSTKSGDIVPGVGRPVDELLVDALMVGDLSPI